MSSPSPATVLEQALESPANKANSPTAVDINHEEAPSSPAQPTTASPAADHADLNPKESGAESPSAEPNAEESGAESPSAEPNPKEPESDISSNRSTPEPGQIDETEPTEDLSAPPLPSEPLPSPRTQPAQQEDDGWEYHWNPNTESYWFYNRYSRGGAPIEAAVVLTSVAATPVVSLGFSCCHAWL